MDIKQLLPLVEKSMEGDKHAYANLCEAIIREVLYVCVKITGNIPDGEDAAQEALIRLGGAIERLRNPHAFPLWLNRHITNSCMDYLRKEKHRRQALDGEILEDVMEQNHEFLPAEWAESREQRQSVLTAMQALPPRQQHILLMYYFQGMSTREIALAYEITESAVRSNLQYARGSLKRRIEKAQRSQLKGLPAAAVPTITLIFQRDAAALIREESAKRVLLAVGLGTAMAGGAAGAAAGTQIAALAASFAPAVVALLVVATTLTLDSSPSSSPAQEIGTTPQYSDALPLPAEDEGGLYISETSRGPVAASSQSAREGESPRQPAAASSAAAAQPAPYEAAGRVVLVDAGQTPLRDPALRLDGICVQAFAGEELAAFALTGEDGGYTLLLPDDSLGYRIEVANNTLPRLGEQGLACLLAPSARAVPDLYVQDTLPPRGSVRFRDAEGVPGAVVNPHTVEVQVYDATPCAVVWEIGQASGTGSLVEVAQLALAPGRHTLVFTLTDLGGNATQLSKQFYIQ